MVWISKKKDDNKNWVYDNDGNITSSWINDDGVLCASYTVKIPVSRLGKEEAYSRLKGMMNSYKKELKFDVNGNIIYI